MNARGTRRPHARRVRGGGRSSGGGGRGGGTSRDTAPGCAVVAIVGGLTILSGGVGILVAQAVQR